ncbi:MULTISPECIES: hypothetical protein [unclassified Nosocomiicoccus]|uniref:hypothetical protein n=1 Tax=unclassified Nosocomiicoccus TaxID=2646683 RepID=UPI0008A1166F|nr:MULTISPECIES: hypothetical protein [unclassified Nosocomiicoccus]OFL47423.1 hypothetical protein HMPREF2767_02790 [Nosocomiicoccus sp. HMSC067E10]OFO53388.1 hypothetical protein HMPREF3029_01310 [Nosocomiicoccus sp. HMSC059G07]
MRILSELKVNNRVLNIEIPNNVLKALDVNVNDTIRFIEDNNKISLEVKKGNLDMDKVNSILKEDADIFKALVDR